MAKYSHPHDEYYMTDNTAVNTEVIYGTNPVLFQPFFSEEGIDSQIIDFKEYSTTYNNYGDPNMNLYGQSYYHVLNWLKSGGQVKGIRLTAKNATYANTMLVLDILVSETQKTDASGNPLYLDASGEETTISSGNTAIMIKKAKVKHHFEYFTNIADNPTDIKSLMRTKLTEDEQGLHIPLFTVVCKGKGTYGNKFRFRLSPYAQRDKNTKYRNYYLEIYKNDGGLVKDKKSPLTVSSYPEARNISRQSDYIEDVVTRTDELPISIYGLDDGFELAFNTLYDVISQEMGEDMDPESIDLFTFYKNSTSFTRYENIIIDPETVDLTSLEAHTLSQGTDGDFVKTNPNRWDAMYERLEDLFKGKIDPSINDTKQHKFTITLDAGYPLEIKLLMVSWRKSRDAEALALDSCYMYNLANLKSFLRDDLVTNDFGTFINVECFDTYDEYTGKNISVTQNYLWSILLPQHIINKGSQTPFAGLDIPLDAYIIEGSLKPIIYSDTEKTEIYDLKGNYIERENNHYVFGTNITSQEKNTELSYTNNVLVYYEIKEALLSLSAVFRFKFADSEDDLNVLNKLASDKIEQFKDTKCKAIEVVVTRDENDPYQKTVNTTCKVGFRTFDLNNIINVDIERY